MELRLSRWNPWGIDSQIIAYHLLRMSLSIIQFCCNDFDTNCWRDCFLCWLLDRGFVVEEMGYDGMGGGERGLVLRVEWRSDGSFGGKLVKLFKRRRRSRRTKKRLSEQVQ